MLNMESITFMQAIGMLNIFTTFGEFLLEGKNPLQRIEVGNKVKK